MAVRRFAAFLAFGVIVVPAEARVIYGTSAGQTITGTNNRDAIYARGGADSVFARNGADDVFGSSGGDALRGQGGVDWLSGGDGSDRLLGGPGLDYLWGDQSADMLNGAGGWDVLVGGGGNDVIRAANPVWWAYEAQYDDVYCDAGYDVAFVDAEGWTDDPYAWDPWGIEYEGGPYDFLPDCEEIYLAGAYYDRQQAMLDYDCYWYGICGVQARATARATTTAAPEAHDKGDRPNASR